MDADPTTPPHAPGVPASDTSSEDIISVNAHGRQRDAQIGGLIMIGGVALVVLLGGLFSLNILKHKLAGPRAKPVAETSSHISMSFDEDTPPPLPGSTPSGSAAANVAHQALCPDGGQGADLRGTDGVIVRNASGQAVRVCANGQVIGYTPPQAAAPQAIPVVRTSARRASGGYASSEQVPHSGPTDNVMMLNGGHYGPAQQAITDPQGLALQMAQQAVGAATTRSAGEGLLTAPAKDSLEAELQPSRTPMVEAGRIDDLSMLLPRGRTIDCGMSMRIISSLAGQASCVVTQDVYSADGKVVLIGRGSEAVGEYRSGASIGQKRLFVLWTRILTPDGVVINLNSPGADSLGSTGLTGRVDNHWWERVGSAFLLSTIQDGVQYEIAKQQAQSGGSTLVMANTAQAGDSLANRVLQSSINIPPTIYKTQGDRAVIYVARDLDFSHVYRLRAR